MRMRCYLIYIQYRLGKLTKLIKNVSSCACLNPCRKSCNPYLITCTWSLCIWQKGVKVFHVKYIFYDNITVHIHKLRNISAGYSISKIWENQYYWSYNSLLQLIMINTHLSHYTWDCCINGFSSQQEYIFLPMYLKTSSCAIS